MEEKAMDEDMMEAPAPSVSVEASGMIGIRDIDDDDDSTSDLELVRAYKVTFSSTGTTDGGLNFGGNIGINSDESVNEVEKSSVWIGGEMGKLTIGDVAAADKLAGGIADVGLDGGVGVDDVVEDIIGSTSPEMRYDITFGNVTLAISAGIGGAPGVANIRDTGDGSLEPGSFEVEKNAVGVRFKSDSGATVGLGYDSKKTLSVGLGYDGGQIAANAFWAKRDQPYPHLGSAAQIGGTGVGEADGTFYAGYSGHGIDVSYTNGASTLTIVYAKAEVENIQPIIAGNIVGIIPSVSFRGMGMGFSQDLGGGAKLVAGFGKVPKTAVGDLGMAEIGQIVTDNDGDNDIDIADRPDLSGDMSVVSIGMEFQF